MADRRLIHYLWRWRWLVSWRRVGTVRHTAAKLCRVCVQRCRLFFRDGSHIATFANPHDLFQSHAQGSPRLCSFWFELVIQNHLHFRLTTGAIFASQSALHIEGDTFFADNSAQQNGGETSCFLPYTALSTKNDAFKHFPVRAAGESTRSYFPGFLLTRAGTQGRSSLLPSRYNCPTHRG